MAEKQHELAIVGVHIKSDAYPNVKYKVEGLLAALPQTREYHFQPKGAGSFAAGARRGLLGKAGHALQFGLAHLRALRTIMGLGRTCALYLPYPAVFILYMLSLLPVRWRPAIVQADAFISLYDTIVNDRALISPTHILARVLWHMERRAYRTAGLVWVDTAHNAADMARLFKLPCARFAPLALSINERIYARADYLPGSPPCKVLFIGTFVPLQGADVIAEAIVLLRARSNIVFRLIGDGQTADSVADILASGACTNVSWERGWQSAANLAAEIAAADICLGIFGAGDKAQRVWPFKNYSYMAVGRSLISADTPAAREMVPDDGAPAWRSVPAQRPDLLADAIVALAEDTAAREQLSRAAADYYARYLSTERSIARLVASLSTRPCQQ